MSMKRSATDRYTVEHIERIAKKLREIPAAPKEAQDRSKQEAIKMLSREIHALKDRGYTFEQIADTLRGENLEIATPTLKSYLQRAKQRKAARKQQQPDRTAAQDLKQPDTPPPPPAADRRTETKQIPEKRATFTPTPDSEAI